MFFKPAFQANEAVRGINRQLLVIPIKAHDDFFCRAVYHVGEFSAASVAPCHRAVFCISECKSTPVFEVSVKALSRKLACLGKDLCRKNEENRKQYCKFLFHKDKSPCRISPCGVALLCIVCRPHTRGQCLWQFCSVTSTKTLLLTHSKTKRTVCSEYLRTKKSEKFTELALVNDFFHLKCDLETLMLYALRVLPNT